MLAATLTTIYYSGIIVIIVGIAHIIHAFQIKEGENFLIWLLSGVFYALAGGFTFYYPELVAIGLTLTLAIAFILSGILRIWAGFAARPYEGWEWIVTAGFLALIVGGEIAAQWPFNSFYLIGMILAINLISEGWLFVAVALALRAGR